MPEDHYTHGLAGGTGSVCVTREQLLRLVMQHPAYQRDANVSNDCIAVILGYLHLSKPEFQDASLAATPPRPHHTRNTVTPSSSSSPAPTWQRSPANPGTPAPTWQSMYSGDGGHMRSPAKEFDVADGWASGIQNPPLFDVDSLHSPPKYENDVFDKPASERAMFEPPAKPAPLTPLPASRELNFGSDDLLPASRELNWV